ncbi:MAG: hypothetical protein ABSE59_11145 [Opitutaceae bacterium]|jgi:hypothetical protein
MIEGLETSFKSLPRFYRLLIAWIIIGGIPLTLLTAYICLKSHSVTQEATSEGTDRVLKTMSPLERTIEANCLSDLNNILGKGRYEVLDFYLVPIDPEVESVTYQFTAYLSVRYKDPYGYLKRTVTWAAFSNGTVMILSDGSIFYRH